MEVLIPLILVIVFLWLRRLSGRRRRRGLSRRDWYRTVYLHSDEWKRKRALVLKRDRGRCVYCGARAVQVHHLRYAKNIGSEPIGWLVSVCVPCHQKQHEK